MKRIVIIALIVAFVLLIPLLAMQFIEQVQWALGDFILAGVLLFGVGILINFVMLRVRGRFYRIALVAGIGIGLVLVWMEFAVGIFGTPWAGT